MILSATFSGVTARFSKRAIELRIRGSARSTPTIWTVSTSGVLDRARADQADADAVPPQVEAQHLGDAAQPELAGAVGGVPRQAEQAGGRRDVDEVAAAARLDHRRHEALDDVDRPHQVDVDHRLPVPCSRCSTVPQTEIAGDVHHHVHAAVRARGSPPRGRRPRRGRRRRATPGARRARPPRSISATISSSPRRRCRSGRAPPRVARRPAPSRGRSRWRRR